MAIETVAVISPGDMGHVVGKVIRDKGFRVITSLSNRSALSCSRAARSAWKMLKVCALSCKRLTLCCRLCLQSALSFAEAAADACQR